MSHTVYSQWALWSSSVLQTPDEYVLHLYSFSRGERNAIKVNIIFI